LKIHENTLKPNKIVNYGNVKPSLRPMRMLLSHVMFALAQ